MSATAFDTQAMNRRRERVLKLLAMIGENGLSEKDLTLAEYGVKLGADEKRVESYYYQLQRARRIQERMIDGTMFVATPQGWNDYEQRQKELQSSRATIKR